MGNCQSMFSKHKILVYDRVLQNDQLFNSGFNKQVLNAIGKGTYAGIHNNYRKYNEKKNGGKFYFEVFSMLL